MNTMDLNRLLKGKQPINIAIDREARAIYFKVEDDEVSKTVRLNDSVSVDYGEHDEVVGIEIIRVNKIGLILKKALKDITTVLPKQTLATA